MILAALGLPLLTETARVAAAERFVPSNLMLERAKRRHSADVREEAASLLPAISFCKAFSPGRKRQRSIIFRSEGRVFCHYLAMSATVSFQRLIDI